MHIQTPQDETQKSSFLRVAHKRQDVTIKVFDVNGKKAKTINADDEAEIQNMNFKMIDLDKGVYVLNAFRNGNFIKSFRFIKD